MHEPTTPESCSAPAHDCRVLGERRDGVHVVRVRGHLDWATAGQLRDVLRDEASDPPTVIDLSDAAVVDSAGTAALLGAMVHSRSRGQLLVIVSADPLVEEALCTASLGCMVPTFRTEIEALAWMAAHLPARATDPRPVTVVVP